MRLLTLFVALVLIGFGWLVLMLLAGFVLMFALALVVEIEAAILRGAVRGIRLALRFQT